jgi:hypothetical protein
MPRHPSSEQLDPPPFTAALDAAVPAENVTLSHYVASSGTWIAASESSDGRVFIGRAKTEPLARRAAGLRTLAHLQARASGKTEGSTPESIENARAELIEHLGRLVELVESYNGRFPSELPQKAVAHQLKSALLVVEGKPERSVLARWLLPPLTFIAGAFAEGVIGVYAEKAIDALTVLLSA